jgi:uncharacterized RDD family membrane protein YckC
MTDGLETASPQITAAPPAPVRARALAGLIDLIPSALLVWLPYEAYPRHGVLLGLIAVVAGFTWLESHGGRTPGKRLLGLEVRYLDGTPCDLRAALVRTAFRFVDAFPGVYLIGGFAIMSTKRRQRIGDQAAGTSVYRGAEFVVKDD